MTFLSAGGIGLGVIFGLPAAYFLILLLRHVFMHRDEGLKGLQSGRQELTSWLALIFTGGGSSGVASGFLRSQEVFVWYVLTLGAVFALTVSFVLLKLVVYIYSEPWDAGRSDRVSQ